MMVAILAKAIALEAWYSSSLTDLEEPSAWYAAYPGDSSSKREDDHL